MLMKMLSGLLPVALVSVACSSTAPSAGLPAGSFPSVLVGRWTRVVVQTGPFVVKLTYQLDADGAAKVYSSGSGSCSGVVSYESIAWNAANEELRLASDNPTCSGQVQCSAADQKETYGCDNSDLKPGGGAVKYTLSGNTLTFSGNTYTRE